jgi:hypothetical protein
MQESSRPESDAYYVTTDTFFIYSKRLHRQLHPVKTR